jgi:hypothetical protein
MLAPLMSGLGGIPHHPVGSPVILQDFCIDEPSGSYRHIHVMGSAVGVGVDHFGAPVYRRPRRHGFDIGDRIHDRRQRGIDDDFPRTSQRHKVKIASRLARRSGFDTVLTARGNASALVGAQAPATKSPDRRVWKLPGAVLNVRHAVGRSPGPNSAAAPVDPTSLGVTLDTEFASRIIFQNINSYTNIKQQSVRTSSTASLRSEAGPLSKDWNQHAS